MAGLERIQIPAGGDLAQLKQYLELLFQQLEAELANLQVVVVEGSPENQVEAPVGWLALRTDGGAGSTLYVKESGSGDTGWVAK